MYKFKFEPPQEHRRSLQTHKNEHIPLISTLDKCTQILREDRLWLRNQIKNNNAELINIFKQYPRSTQLQHLQIKLRKFVQNVKSRIKQEQLSKFRETLHAQNMSAFHNHSHLAANQPKKPSQPRGLNTSHSRQHLKSNSSVELNKTTQFRPNKSVQPKQPSNMALSSSLRHFQELLKYKCSQQVIQERQSENVTSARLARQENENPSRPLQQISYSSNNNKVKPSQTSFFQKKDPKEVRSSNFRPQSNIPAYSSSQQANSWEFEQLAKKSLYQYQPRLQVQNKERQLQEVNQVYGSRFDRSQEDESIMDKHFIDDSEKISPRRQIVQSITSSEVELRRSNCNQDYMSRQYESFQANNKFSPEYKDNTQPRDSSFSTINQNKVKQTTENLPDTDRNNEENLFTPLELLNQCRNFLKSRENSVTKATVVQPHFQETFKPVDIAKLQSEQSSECLFTRNNCQENPSLPRNSDESERKGGPESEPKEEDSAYMFPEIKSPEEKSNNISSSKNESGVFYPHFETFANASNQKSTFEKALNPPQYIRTTLISESLQEKAEPQVSIPADFSIEDLIEELMEQTEMNPFIGVGHLTQYISNHRQNLILGQVLRQYLKMNKNEEVCLTSIAEVINLAYNQQHDQSYPHNDSAINAVYDLLDIDQKGYIAREDVDSFLNQIEQAEVSNFDEVSEEILRLFDGADFTNEQRLTYWHLYIVKNSEQFERVSQLLGEFQFEIEREA